MYHQTNYDYEEISITLLTEIMRDNTTIDVTYSIYVENAYLSYVVSYS